MSTPTPVSPDELIGKSDLPLPELKKKFEEVAIATVRRRGGGWRWLDDKTLRVYSRDGEAFMTLNLERVQ